MARPEGITMETVKARVIEAWPAAYSAFVAKGAIPACNRMVVWSRVSGWIIRDGKSFEPLTFERRETEDEAWADAYEILSALGGVN